MFICKFNNDLILFLCPVYFEINFFHREINYTYV